MITYLHVSKVTENHNQSSETVFIPKKSEYIHISGVNSVTLLGRVGNQPELRGAGKEHSCAAFSLATSTYWKKDFNDTEFQQQTEWHNIAVFNPYLREMIMEQVKKGERVHVQGKLKYSMYEKYGVKIRSASIHADELIRLNQQGSDKIPENDNIWPHLFMLFYLIFILCNTVELLQ